MGLGADLREGQVLPVIGVTLSCAGCHAVGVPLDLDTKATPPELVCRRCAKKGKCDRCGKRSGRRVLQVPIGQTADGAPVYFRGWVLLCLKCNG